MRRARGKGIRKVGVRYSVCPPVEREMELDFTDYNLERYGAIVTRKRQQGQPSPAPRSTRWTAIQRWLRGHRLWFPRACRG